MDVKCYLYPELMKLSIVAALAHFCHIDPGLQGQPIFYQAHETTTAAQFAMVVSYEWAQ